MQYVIHFNDEKRFEAARNAVTEDLHGEKIPQVEFNPKDRTISLDMGYLAAGAVFGGEDKKSRSFLPFDTNKAPTGENFAAIARERNINGVNVERVAGPIEVTYKNKIREAEEFFKSDSFEHKKPQSISQTGSTLEQVIDTNLKENKALVIAEAHGNQAHYAMLINNIDRIKENGGKALLLEHLVINQDVLDKYFSSPKNAPMPVILESQLNMLDKGMNHANTENRGANTLKGLFKALKDKGMRVVAIESEESMASMSGGLAKDADKEHDRALLMNRNSLSAWEIEHRKNGGLPVILAGANHMPDWVQKRIDGEGKPYTHRQVPGVATVFGGEIIHPVDNGFYQKTSADISKDAYAQNSLARMVQGMDHVFDIDAETVAGTALDKKKLLSGLGQSSGKPAVNYDTSDPVTQRMLELKKNSPVTPEATQYYKIDIEPSMLRALEQAKDNPRLEVAEATPGNKSPNLISAAQKLEQQSFRS